MFEDFEGLLGFLAFGSVGRGNEGFSEKGLFWDSNFKNNIFFEKLIVLESKSRNYERG